MLTSHKLAHLFRCWPVPGTPQHNGSSVVYSHLSSSNWVFLSRLVFQSVTYSHFHPLLPLSRVSTFLFLFYLILTFAIFQRTRRKNSSPFPAPSYPPPSDPSPVSSTCISPELWWVTGPSRPPALFAPPLCHPSLLCLMQCSAD